MAGGAAAVSGLPPTVQAALTARIAAAPDGAQRVLRVAAVAGRRVDHDLLAEIVDLPEDELTDGLRAAIDRHLLVQDGDGETAGFAFRHALVQEAAYDDLLPGERRTLHRAYAEALAGRAQPAGAGGAAHWAELAHHWAAARDDVRAAQASVRAGDTAFEAYAFAAAQQQFELALELWDSVPDPVATLGVDRDRSPRPRGQRRGGRRRVPSRRRVPPRGDRDPGRRRRPGPGRAPPGAPRSRALARRGRRAVARDLRRGDRDAARPPAVRGPRPGPRRDGPDPDARRPLRRGDRDVRGGGRDGPRRRRPPGRGSRPQHARSRTGRAGPLPRGDGRARDRARDGPRARRLRRRRPGLREPERRDAALLADPRGRRRREGRDRRHRAARRDRLLRRDDPRERRRVPVRDRELGRRGRLGPRVAPDGPARPERLALPHRHDGRARGRPRPAGHLRADSTASRTSSRASRSRASTRARTPSPRRSMRSGSAARARRSTRSNRACPSSATTGSRTSSPRCTRWASGPWRIWRSSPARNGSRRTSCRSTFERIDGHVERIRGLIRAHAGEQAGCGALYAALHAAEAERTRALGDAGPGRLVRGGRRLGRAPTGRTRPPTRGSGSRKPCWSAGIVRPLASRSPRPPAGRGPRERGRCSA